MRVYRERRNAPITLLDGTMTDPLRAPRDEMIHRARLHRREMTAPERRLWHVLRDRRLAGWKFRRQVVIGPFIADFYNHTARLVAEVDGGSHADRGDRDRARQQWLEARGLCVVRVSNDDVLRDPYGVVEGLAKRLRDLTARDTGPNLP
jgi:very-short-patch-repair endonuclease